MPEAEAVTEALGRQVGGVEIGRVPGQAIGDQLMGAAGENRGQVRIVGPGHHPGAGRQPREIAGKGCLDVRQVPVVIQVFPVQVGDNADLGDKYVKELSLSSASATKYSPRPRTALEPTESHNAPTTTVGSRLPARRTAAVMAVVEVLPCAPVTAIWKWFCIRAANISPRRSTLSPRARATASSGLSSFTAVEWTTMAASARFSARWPW